MCSDRHIGWWFHRIIAVLYIIVVLLFADVRNVVLRMFNQGSLIVGYCVCWLLQVHRGNKHYKMHCMDWEFVTMGFKIRKNSV